MDLIYGGDERENIIFDESGSLRSGDWQLQLSGDDEKCSMRASAHVVWVGAGKVAPTPSWAAVLQQPQVHSIRHRSLTRVIRESLAALACPSTDVFLAMEVGGNSVGPLLTRKEFVFSTHTPRCLHYDETGGLFHPVGWSHCSAESPCCTNSRRRCNAQANSGP